MSQTTTDPNTLTVRQGKTFRVIFIRKDSSGTRIPMTGYGARFQILQRIDGAAWVDVTDQTADPGNVAQPCILVEPGNAIGEIHVRLGADQTLPITRASAVYDASIYSLNDPTEVQPLASGPVVILRIGDDGFSG